MTTYKITKKAAQNFLLARSFLYDKQDSLVSVIQKLGCVQVDPIPVKYKAHEWTLFNRVNRFTTTKLENELYKNRSLFEYWMQLFSIIPIEDFPYMRARMEAEEKWANAYKKEHSRQLDAVLNFIRENGPTSSRSIAHLEKGRSIFSWNDSNSQAGLLNLLWDTGHIMIHHREGNMRFYDLTERILPAEIFKKKVDLETSRKFFFNRSFDYLGIIRQSFLSRSRVGYSKNVHLSLLLKEELALGNVTKINIEGSLSNYFVRTNDLHKLETETPIKLTTKEIYLSPLDPLVIDRDLLNDVFGFFYRWEVYTPKVKRKVGYYNMPILKKGQIQDQLDMSVHYETIFK